VVVLWLSCGCIVVELWLPGGLAALAATAARLLLGEEQLLTKADNQSFKLNSIKNEMKNLYFQQNNVFLANNDMLRVDCLF